MFITFNVGMDFSIKNEIFKQNRQSVKIIGNVDFSKSIIQKFQRLKIMTMVIVCEKNPEFLYDSFLILNDLLW